MAPRANLRPSSTTATNHNDHQNADPIINIDDNHDSSQFVSTSFCSLYKRLAVNN